MSKKVYIVDLIGNHSGMHYYHDAFCSLFKTESGIEISVLSNYSSPHSKKLFPYIYSGSIVSKLCKATLAYFKLAFFLVSNRKAYFVYEFFGRKVDLVFLTLRVFAKNRILLDVHDLYDISIPESSSLRNKVNKKLQGLKGLIIHSEKVKEQLTQTSYSGKVVLVPHFHYSSALESNSSSSEIDSLLDQQKTNVLFFGHIRESKGIREFVSHVNNIAEKALQNNCHFIVAGSDADDLYVNNSFNETVSHSSLLRKVSDKELDQLFSKVQCVVLPYKLISQSGILEMAIQYRVPVLCSELEFFTTYLSEYQSFGTTFTLGDQNSFESALKQICSDDGGFYAQKDIDKYLNDDRFDNFKNDFKLLLEE